MYKTEKKIATNLIIVLSLLFIVYLPCFYELTKSWISNPDYTHGFLVLPIFIYLVWINKNKIVLEKQDNTKIGILLLIFGLVLHILGSYGRINSFSNISLLLSLLGGFWVFLGRENTKILLFPTFFLIFMFPIPESFYIRATRHLKLLVTEISYNIIDFIGIPVLREGNILHFANSSFKVIEACSGIRSIISYSMLAFLFMYLIKKGVIKKLILIVSAFIFTLLTNILRICGTGVLAYFFGSNIAQGFFHKFSGLVLFILGFIIIFSEYLVLKRIPSKTHNP